ncbi:hypothetical protein CB1_000740014 [Camelus ferus]|nr:hypothetical protein CB1_000740014 [Camelus ferus]
MTAPVFSPNFKSPSPQRIFPGEYLPGIKGKHKTVPKEKPPGVAREAESVSSMNLAMKREGEPHIRNQDGELTKGLEEELISLAAVGSTPCPGSCLHGHSSPYEVRLPPGMSCSSKTWGKNGNHGPPLAPTGSSLLSAQETT